MLAVFCKLIVYNVLEMNAAAEVYQFYLKVCVLWVLSSLTPPSCSNLPFLRKIHTCSNRFQKYGEQKRETSTYLGSGILRLACGISVL